MAEPRWLERRVLDALQEQVIRDFGGVRGVRGDTLIESALTGRAVTKSRERRAEDLHAAAAAYAFALIKKRGYLAGNHRLAAVALGVFLRLNRVELDAPEPELAVAIRSVARGSWSEDDLARWVRARSVPLRRRA